VRKTTYLMILISAITVISCRKKDDPVVIIDPPGGPVDTTAGSLKVSFQNVAGNLPLTLDNAWYVTAGGDSLKISDLKYYITNIVLHSDTGQFVQPESYYLIDERDNQSKTWTIGNIPPGKYKNISFMIGVDSRRNTAGAQTGALDPAHGMFWDWNTGYIMAKLEAVSPSAPAPSNRLSWHIAGFKALQAVMRSVTLTFPAPVTVKSSTLKTVHINGDVLEWFKTPQTIRVADLPVIANAGADAAKVADNYADMFTIDRID